MTATESWSARMMRVLDAIERAPDSAAPAQLAEIAGFSLHHFHRVFRGMTGESAMGYARRLKLERAAMRLRFAGVSVTEIAMSSGYGSHEAFTRAFGKHFGVSPKDYQARWKYVPRGGQPFVMRETPDRCCIAYRYRGDYQQCFGAWNTLNAWAAGRGLLARSTGSVGLCHDDPEVTATDKLRYDACLVFAEADVPDDLPRGFCRRVVPGGRYAVATHHGSYDTLTETYIELLGRWLPQRGVELADEAIVEIYLNLPFDTPVDALRTEVCVRVATTRQA